MRRVISLIIPLLVLFVLAAGVIAIEVSRPADWRVELNKYVQYQNSLSPARITVQSVAYASKPGNFSQDMSHAVFGDSVWGGLDLPFPPEEVWCVLLKRDASSNDELGGEMPYKVVFVSHHTDRLWNDDWVVHEGAKALFTHEFIESLSLIGCDLGLEEFGPGDIKPVVMAQSGALTFSSPAGTGPMVAWGAMWRATGLTE